MTVLLSLVPIALRGEPGVVAIAHDITLRKQTAEALQRTQAELARGLLAKAATDERQRLARELHDSVSQAIYGLSLGANTALSLLDTDRARAREALDYVISLAHAALTEMRALIFELHPESLQREGLVVALTRHTGALRAQHAVEIHTDLGEEPELPLEAQEALQNAIKHAGACRMAVRLRSVANSAELEVTDTGKGFDPLADHPGHLGLRSMVERAQRVGGVLEISSTHNGGTRILARAPLSGWNAV